MEIYENLSIESLPNEEWRDIVGYEGLYQVSNLGRVKSMPRLHRYAHGEYLSKKKILSPRKVGKDREYLSVVLYNGKGKKQYKIHRLVAEAFVPNPQKHKEINHIDENKGNNVASNLEWCSRSYNVNYGQRIAKQSRHLFRRVIAFDLNDNFIGEFESIVSASRFAGVSASGIGRACSNVAKTAGGYKWRYKDE